MGVFMYFCLFSVALPFLYRNSEYCSVCWSLHQTKHTFSWLASLLCQIISLNSILHYSAWIIHQSLYISIVVRSSNVSCALNVEVPQVQSQWRYSRKCSRNFSKKQSTNVTNKTTTLNYLFRLKYCTKHVLWNVLFKTWKRKYWKHVKRRK